MRRAAVPGLALALAAVLSAGPAAAQVYSDRIIDACLAAHWGGPSDRAACIGIAARACMPVGEGGADVAVTCHEAETAQWGAMLDQSLAALRAQLGEAEDAEPAQAFDRAQTAWEAFRDATCELDAQRWPDADIGRAARAECLMRLTAGQALEMQSRLAGSM